VTCAIGIDVGGTKIAAGILSDGEIRARRRVPTRPERGGEAVLSDALGLAEELIAEADRSGLRPVGIGVAVAELVSPEGRVTSDQTIAWRDIDVRRLFLKLAPTVVEADSRAAAIGEARYGAGRPFRLFYYLTVGTGIGGALVQEGRAFLGARGSAGTVGCAASMCSCDRCGFVSRPVLEEISSGPALVRRFVEVGGKASRADEVTAAAERGDPRAVRVVCTAGEALGVTAGQIVNLLDPEALVVGGGLGSSGGLYWESFVASARRHIWSDTNRGLPILRARHGGDAGLVGAAATVLEK
jgi:glucokinase